MTKMLVKPSNDSRKIAQVTDNLGFNNVSKQQGTTVTIYDSIELVETTNVSTLTFFRECNTRQFPLTNMTRNQFNNGESMSVERFYLYVTVINTTTGVISGVYPLETSLGLWGLVRGDLDFTIASAKVLRQYNTVGNFAPFNRDAQFFAQDATSSDMIGHSVKNLDQKPVIPPLTDFYAELKVPPYTPPPIVGSKQYLTLCLEGLGSLYAPKANF